jgi:hypothetical protein
MKSVSSSSVLSHVSKGTTSGAWHLSIESPQFGRREMDVKVVARFSIADNIALIFGNGQLLFKGEPEFSAENKNSFQVSFQIYQNEFQLVGTKSFFQTRLLLVHNKQPVPMVKDDPHSHVSERIAPLALSIDPVIRMVASNHELYIIYFPIKVTCHDGREVISYRRYSEFVILNHLIRSYCSKTMRDCLPKLPPKVFNPFTNQMNPDFIDTRRIALERYLNDLLHHGKVKILY